jgi:acetyl esterase/lipase
LPNTQRRVATEAEIIALVDPEVVGGIARTLTPWLESGPLEIDGVRALDARIIAENGPSPSVQPPPEVVQVAGHDGAAVTLRVHRSAGSTPAAVVLWIHGGGMFLGSAGSDDVACRAWCDATGMAVVAVDYRLAPEHPFPTPLEDCFSALAWLASGVDPAIDPERIVVFGASAGGGLATGLALLARDRGVRVIRQVQAIYPMLDDREDTVASGLDNAPVWNRRLNRLGWSAYLGENRTAPSSYAAPARADDLSGLPPFLIETAEFDLFRDDNVAFATRLWHAGVLCELHVTPRTVHGWEGIAPAARVSREAWTRRYAAATGAISG